MSSTHAHRKMIPKHQMLSPVHQLCWLYINPRSKLDHDFVKIVFAKFS